MSQLNERGIPLSHGHTMRLPQNIARIFSAVIDGIIPPAPESLVARAITEERLARILRPEALPEAPWITALFPYANPDIRALIRAIKYRGEKAPLPALGAVASEEILGILEDMTFMENWRDVLLLPVPSSPARMRERGHNQAERIAEAVVPHLAGAVMYAPHILARHARPSQVDVPREARRQNVEGAFFVSHPDTIRGRYILLIDDVVESGATLADARRALLSAGAKDVIALAMAH